MPAPRLVDYTLLAELIRKYRALEKRSNVRSEVCWENVANEYNKSVVGYGGRSFEAADLRARFSRRRRIAMNKHKAIENFIITNGYAPENMIMDDEDRMLFKMSGMQSRGIVESFTSNLDDDPLEQDDSGYTFDQKNIHTGGEWKKYFKT